jgi:hypothetical protein
MAGIQQGDTNRRWRGWWKIHPDKHQKIALDPRKDEEIALEYKVARSYISRIKRDYKIKNNICVCKSCDIAYMDNGIEKCAKCNKKTKLC